MMGWTNAHALRFYRLLSQNVLLYREMLTARAIYHSKRRDALLWLPNNVGRTALQLGGSEPKLLALAVQSAAPFGYSEINLNVGCPSPRVQKGAFGACLMKSPELVRDCVQAMAEVTTLPVTVKCRLGVDQHQTPDFLHRFIETVTAQGMCRTVIIHARIALLDGLNPKQNRTVPPLLYERVYEQKAAFPNLRIFINGGIQNVEQASTHLNHVDGVMLGRAICRNPYLLAKLQQRLCTPGAAPPDPIAILRRYIPYVTEQFHKGVSFATLIHPVLPLIQGYPGAAIFRRHISSFAHRKGANSDLIETALAKMEAVGARYAAQNRTTPLGQLA